MIPKDHPRYASLAAREKLAEYARQGIVSLEGLTAHGRGEAFDYLLGEKTIRSALLAEKIAAGLLLTARHPVISVNGNTAALVAGELAGLQDASRSLVEINLFHRTDERIAKITRLLEDHGVAVLKGRAERLLPLSHDRGLCLPEGIGAGDVILVPLEDGDRCQALRSMGKTVIAIDLNPLSRTARAASLTVVDEVTRAVPNIGRFCRDLSGEDAALLCGRYNNQELLRLALADIRRRIEHALD